MSEDAFTTQARAEGYQMQGAQAQAQGITNAANAVNEAVRFHQELMLHQPEVQMRMQMMQSEMALNQQKLQHLAAIDQVKQSRLATERMELENEHIKSTIDHQKAMTQANKDLYDPTVAGSKAWEEHERDIIRMVDTGQAVRENGKVRILEGDELKANQKRIQENKHVPMYARDEGAVTHRAQALLKRAEDLRNNFGGDKRTPEEDAAAKKQAKAYEEEADRLLRSETAPAPGATPSTKKSDVDRIEAMLRDLEGHD